MLLMLLILELINAFNEIILLSKFSLSLLLLILLLILKFSISFFKLKELKTKYIIIANIKKYIIFDNIVIILFINNNYIK